MLIYDIDADSWGTGPALPRDTYSVLAAALNGEVYVIGDLGSWVYRNAAWVGLPAPEAKFPACASIRLG